MSQSHALGAAAAAAAAAAAGGIDAAGIDASSQAADLHSLKRDIATLLLHLLEVWAIALVPETCDV